MPKLTVIIDEATTEIHFSCGSSVREILDAAGIPIRSGCRGNGACGLCLVQIKAGRTNGPTKNESLILSAEQVNRNFRLACQLMPDNDLSIRIIGTVSKSNWRDLTDSHVTCTPAQTTGPHSIETKSSEPVYGLAVDLGTTHISLSLWDLKRYARLSGRIGLNPQSCYGTDVVTRIIAASESPDNAQKIWRLPLDAIREALKDMCSQNGFSPRKIAHVAIVGNTPMLALLTKKDPRILLQPRYWTQHIDCKLDDAETVAKIMGIHPETRVEVVSPLAGFVGSDLLAGVVATGLTGRPAGLLIDFGTNSEVALWDGNTLWVTSAAGGPAFEGCGMQCGMPAEPGAICRVERQNSMGLKFHTIGDREAKGFCGSGIVDLIALLRDAGDLTSTGGFAMPDHKDGFIIHRNSSALRLTKGDVDVFQRAKAAIGVGIRTLLESAHMTAAELNRICVCGAFGRHLNIRSAQRIGLLPDIPSNRVELCGNTALAGCEQLLLSETPAMELESLRERAAIINLSQVSDFETLFLENLYLDPLMVNES